MSGGGKGGSQTQTTQMQIPAYLEGPIKRNIARAEDISRIGFTPYYGPDVAALTPMQEAAMMGISSAAQAYGLPNAMGNQVTPEAQEFAGGVRGYSSGSLFDQALAELQARRPGQYEAIMGQFIDPSTGGQAAQYQRAQEMEQLRQEMEALRASQARQNRRDTGGGGGGGGFGGDGGAGSAR